MRHDRIEKQQFILKAKDLISSGVLPLKTSDTGSEALQTMSDFHVRHLPIINNEELLGLLSDDDVHANIAADPVGSYGLSIDQPSVHSDDHIFEVMSYMSRYNLTTVPVVDHKGIYIGLITLEDILHYYATSFSFKEPGSVIVLRMHRRDYSMAEISRLVEQESAAILSSFITDHQDGETILITLKINKMDVQTILSTFQRYDYQIHSIFSDTPHENQFQDRYELLMNYINM